LTQKFVLKIPKKRQGYPLPFFNFLPKNLFLNFQKNTIEFYQGMLEVIKNVAGCFILLSEGPENANKHDFRQIMSFCIIGRKSPY